MGFIRQKTICNPDAIAHISENQDSSNSGCSLIGNTETPAAEFLFFVLILFWSSFLYSTKSDESKGKAFSRQILSIWRLRSRQPAQTFTKPQLWQIQVTQPFLWSPSQTIRESSRVSFPTKQLVREEVLFQNLHRLLYMKLKYAHYFNQITWSDIRKREEPKSWGWQVKVLYSFRINSKYNKLNLISLPLMTSPKKNLRQRHHKGLTEQIRLNSTKNQCHRNSLVCSQTQAEAPQRVQRAVSVTLQICISTWEHQPSIDLTLPWGRSTAVSIPIQIPVCIKITFSVQVLGRAQVRRTLTMPCPAPSLQFSQMDQNWSVVKRFVWM